MEEPSGLETWTLILALMPPGILEGIVKDWEILWSPGPRGQPTSSLERGLEHRSQVSEKTVMPNLVAVIWKVAPGWIGARSRPLAMISRVSPGLGGLGVRVRSCSLSRSSMSLLPGSQG